MLFDSAMWRFGISGTLILCYSIADHLARRRERATHRVPPPRWLRPVVLASITAYYLLIGPTGGPLFGGIGNVVGIALTVAAMVLRSSRSIRHPDLAGRALFYIALPAAVGVPWGFAVLSLPALAATLHCCRRAEAALAELGPLPQGSYPRHRMVPGVW